MVFVLFFFSQILFASGQMDIPPYETFYDIGVDGENKEFVFENIELPFRNEKERRFMEGLVVEAGLHTLYPELFVIEKLNNDESSSSTEDYLKKNKGMKYFELKGQPEFEASYTNRQSRKEQILCPVDCPVYKPVCGSDGKVYDSECHLQRENCGKSNITIGDWDKCRGQHYLCPTRCLDLSEPVCGSDLRIYQNICIMRKKNCGKLLEKLPLEACYEKFRQSSEQECPEQCPPITKPACGSDGIIYFNDCFLRMRTCKVGIVQVGIENCVYIPKCPEICLPLYDPVCGSDGNLYTNQCRMLQTNCGKEIKKMPLSFCNSENQGSSTPLNSRA